MATKRQENTNHWYLNWPWCARDDTSPGLLKWGHWGLASFYCCGAEGWNPGEDGQMNARHKQKSSQMQITMLRSWLYSGRSRALKPPPLPAPQAGIECVGSVCRSYIWLCQKAEIKREPVCTLRKCRFAEVTARFNVIIGPLAFQLLPVKVF